MQETEKVNRSMSLSSFLFCNMTCKLKVLNKHMERKKFLLALVNCIITLSLINKEDIVKFSM